ncbi:MULTISPECIES: sensor domain-containing protein [unclassified Streptomyces]|uniref:sensor domain-containing protein n=1 Tax=unclassified Streptomyces TaxID=2593676 RepID=UPI002DD93673|nr:MULTISPECIES: sensor domain-containing protein [unclassified Streptomyces]WSA93960.1 sensor domain-containing protein [Streptomyces sp. NBC_01795]WSB78386.1 sensor domain-containing protein [Streptomyces sp. NBC_01775]WSS13411.1 sensor domain-containing protein [Streptomyces sp. NBC_01186]WSS42200.1 sensor domain-containing protein [Streptomyces sp. NBC_01187]
MTMTHGYPAPTVSATARSTGRFAREMGYLLSGLPLGIAGFVVMVVGFAVGVSTLVIMVGLPVLIGTLSVARYLARVESQQIERVTGRLLPPLREREARGGWAALLDAQSWRDLLHAVVAFPVRIVTFCIALSWTVGGVGGLFYGLWSWFLPRDAGNDGVLDLALGISGRGPDIAFNTIAGLILLATLIPVVRGLTAMQTGLGRVLLRDGRL